MVYYQHITKANPRPLFSVTSGGRPQPAWG